MFPKVYFPGTYFASVYFIPVDGSVPIPDVTSAHSIVKMMNMGTMMNRF